MSTISIDYDETYTRDPITWDSVIRTLRQAGHIVYCVTMRHDNDNEGNDVRNSIGLHVDGIYFTGRKAKQDFMSKQGIWIDIWIDDMPIFITNDARA